MEKGNEKKKGISKQLQRPVYFTIFVTNFLILAIACASSVACSHMGENIQYATPSLRIVLDFFFNFANYHFSDFFPFSFIKTLRRLLF